VKHAIQVIVPDPGSGSNDLLRDTIKIDIKKMVSMVLLVPVMPDSYSNDRNSKIY
jgi:hypothetical protein